MPSPFPGMDPYLEDPTLWPGLQQSLITYTRDALNPNIRPTYNARIGDRLYVVQSQRDIYPAVTLLQRPEQPVPAEGGAQTGGVAATPVTEPFIVIMPLSEHREPFIEIVHNASGEVVTVIEILSPANKVGQGHERYRQKQKEVMASQAHLVEIDLLSQGQHTLAVPKEGLDPLPPWRYLISVSRLADRPHQFEVYALTLKHPLPTFRIPLKAPDPDIVLNLQAIFDQSYDNGGYEDFVDYDQPPKVPLSEEEMSDYNEP